MTKQEIDAYAAKGIPEGSVGDWRDEKHENLQEIIKENVEACERPDYPENWS